MRGRTILGGAAGGLAVALCWGAASARDAAPRFTITRTLPDGRTETRSITLEELKALTAGPGKAAPAPVALRADSVVFTLPAPVPDALAHPSARGAAADAPRLAEAPLPKPWVETTRSHASDTPSAAAILAAQATRATARSLALAGGWTLVERGNDDGQSADASSAPAAARAGAPKRSAMALGVRDGKSFGDRGRLYAYMGVKNRGLGLNLTDHNGDEPGGWGSDGVSYDKGGFAGQRSAGVGWRQGDVSTTLGWVHEKNNVKMVYGAPSEKDDRVALTFSWRPSVRTKLAGASAEPNAR